MPQIIPTVNVPSTGLRVVSGQTSTSGSGFSEATTVTLTQEVALHSWENNGTIVAAIKGAGQLWTNVLSSAPTSPVAGDIWIYTNVSDSSVDLAFYDGASIRVVTTNTGSGFNPNAGAALVAGFALQINSSGNAVYASTTIDSHRQFQIVGLAGVTVSMGSPVSCLTDGDRLTLSDWTAVTGTSALTVGAQYFLQDSPGQLGLTVPSSGVISRAGIAITATQLLVRPNLIILP
jgi:hypothetical protein